MNQLDSHLKQIQEVDPLTIGIASAAMLGTARLIAQLSSFFLITATLRKQVKVDKNLTKSVNKILKSGNKWVVHLYPESSPNAFAIGGKHVFVTTGLLKLLNKREVEAVMLHEIFHNKDLHIWKQFATTNSFFYLLIFIGMTAVASTGALYLGFIIFLMMNKISNILYNRVMGRRHELKADEHAVKFGYGTDLASGLLKMEKYVEKMRSGIKCGKFCQLERRISDSLDEHPPLKKRAEIVLRKSKELEMAVKSASFSKISSFVGKVFKQNG